MYKVLLGLLAAVCLVFVAPMSVQACEGIECYKHDADFMSEECSDSPQSVWIRRIYVEDHVFGENEVFDRIFNDEGTSFIDIYQELSAFVPFGGLNWQCTFFTWSTCDYNFDSMAGGRLSYRREHGCSHNRTSGRCVTVETWRANCRRSNCSGWSTFQLRFNVPVCISEWHNR